MANYRRLYRPGGTWFFTVTLQERGADTLTANVALLRAAVAETQRDRPFRIEAAVILPDHLHMVWRLPGGDTDFPTRWRLVKARFSRALGRFGTRSPAMLAKRERGVWQRRYWEHAIRDEADFARHVEYCWFNPVKHGLVTRVAEWPFSSFHREVQAGVVPRDWGP